MSERASIFQTVQVGVETTPGTGVPANKKLSALSVSPGIQLETKKYRAMGNKFASLIVPGKEWMVAKLSGPLTYTEIVYVLSGIANYAAPVQQGATAAYKWTFAPTLGAEDAYKAYTVEQGSSARAHKFAFGLVNDLGFKFSRDALELDGNMIGQALQDGITMTAAPTVISLVPVLPTQVNVKIADTQAGLAGASALTRVMTASWALRHKFGPIFPLMAGSTGFAAVVELEPELVCTLKLEADTVGMGLLTQMREGTQKFLQIKATGDLIATPYYYDLQIEASLGVEAVSEFSDEDGLYAIEWNFAGVYDPTWGKTTQIDVITTVTAL